MPEEYRGEESVMENFRKNNGDAIRQDNERGDAVRSRVAPIFGYNSLYSESGVINNIGITVESHGLGSLRLNMDIAVMEKILDYYEDSLTKAYSIIDNR